MQREKLSRKVVLDYTVLKKIIDAQRTLGHKIVVTIGSCGSWDLLHIGHTRYLLEASNLGDILVVGVDTDSLVKKYKGEYRPIVPQSERIEMLTYLDFVDYITIINDANKDGSWKYGLIKNLRPDLFVAVVDSYPKSQLRNIRKYCKSVKVLPRQAEQTSTSNTVQNLLKGGLMDFVAKIARGGKRK